MAVGVKSGPSSGCAPSGASPTCTFINTDLFMEDRNRAFRCVASLEWHSGHNLIPQQMLGFPWEEHNFWRLLTLQAAPLRRVSTLLCCDTIEMLWHYPPLSLSLQFADWCMNYGRHGCRTPDTPFSLFEGNPWQRVLVCFGLLRKYHHRITADRFFTCFLQAWRAPSTSWPTSCSQWERGSPRLRCRNVSPPR